MKYLFFSTYFQNTEIDIVSIFECLASGKFQISFRGSKKPNLRHNYKLFVFIAWSLGFAGLTSWISRVDSTKYIFYFFCFSYFCFQLKILLSGFSNHAAKNSICFCSLQIFWSVSLFSFETCPKFIWLHLAEIQI